MCHAIPTMNNAGFAWVSPKTKLVHLFKCLRKIDGFIVAMNSNLPHLTFFFPLPEPRVKLSLMTAYDLYSTVKGKCETYIELHWPIQFVGTRVGDSSSCALFRAKPTSLLFQPSLILGSRT